MEWLNNNWIEVAGAILAFTYLILEVKQNWLMWIVGIISSTFYVYIFFVAKLYAEAGMNVYYVIMSFFGLYCWKFAPQTEKTNAGFHHISSRLSIQLVLIGILLFGGLILVLSEFTDSPVPIPDAWVATLSIIATWMTAKKIVECWYPWIFVNFFAIGLYYYQQLYPTALLYVFYAILSIVGLIEWRKSVATKI